MDLENKEALDTLFGDMDSLNMLAETLKPKDVQISTHSMNDKTILDKVKERVEEFKEHNGLNPDPDTIPITENSDRVLPDELAKEEGVPICKGTEGIHDADITQNEELISSHNSKAVLEENIKCNQPINPQSEEIDVISTHNSEGFV